MDNISLNLKYEAFEDKEFMIIYKGEVQLSLKITKTQRRALDKFLYQLEAQK